MANWASETRDAYFARKSKGEFAVGLWVVMSGDTVVAKERKMHIALAKMGAHRAPCLILQVGAEGEAVHIGGPVLW